MAWRTFFAAALAASDAASALVVASGFSHSTCLPASIGRRRHREVARVGRADVDGVDRRIGEDRAIVGLGPVDAEGGRERTGLVEAAAGDGRDVDDAQAAQRFAVDAGP